MDVCPQANRPARSRRTRATDGGDPLVDSRGVEAGQCSGGGPEQVEVRGPSDWQHLREAPQRLGGRAPRGGGAAGALSRVSKEPARWQSSSIEITPSAFQSFSRSRLKRFTSESRTRRCVPARNNSKAPQSIMRRTVEHERSRITPTWRGERAGSGSVAMAWASVSAGHVRLSDKIACTQKPDISRKFTRSGVTRSRGHAHFSSSPPRGGPKFKAAAS